jgi:hypothetical protein
MTVTPVRSQAASLNVRFGWKADIAASSFVLMSARPHVKLSVLRDIGWHQWDPIGLNGSEGGWRRSHAADEYDRYMLRVADGLQSGEPVEALVDYLVTIETAHMGLTDTPTTRTRAEATVAAIGEHVESIN